MGVAVLSALLVAGCSDGDQPVRRLTEVYALPLGESVTGPIDPVAASIDGDGSAVVLDPTKGGLFQISPDGRSVEFVPFPPSLAVVPQTLLDLGQDLLACATASARCLRYDRADLGAAPVSVAIGPEGGRRWVGGWLAGDYIMSIPDGRMVRWRSSETVDTVRVTVPRIREASDSAALEFGRGYVGVVGRTAYFASLAPPQLLRLTPGATEEVWRMDTALDEFRLPGVDGGAQVLRKLFPRITSFSLTGRDIWITLYKPKENRTHILSFSEEGELHDEAEIDFEFWVIGAGPRAGPRVWVMARRKLHSDELVMYAYR